MSFGAKSRHVRGISAAVALLAIGASGCSVAESAKDGIKKAARQRSVFSLDVGDCYNPNTAPAAAGEEATEELAIEVVPCAEPHQAQIYGEFDLDDGAYPGDDALTEASDTRCAVEEKKFAPDTWAIPTDVGGSYYQPTKETWATGDRKVSCSYSKDSGKITGTLKSKPLSADAAAYLKNEYAYYDALWSKQPEAETVEDDLAGYKAQSAAVAAALDAHLAALQGVKQPETVKLRAQLEVADKKWKEAANAADADSLYAPYSSAYDAIDPAKSVAARKELGLATTVPEDMAAGWTS